jgi:uncharacterized protein YkwD
VRLIRRTLIGLLAILIVAGVTRPQATPLASSQLVYTSGQTWDVGRINTVRANHGVHAVSLNATMTNRAQYWANHLRNYNTLADDTNGVNTCWNLNAYTTHYGANAGFGGGVHSVEYALENSPEHMSNILDGHYKYVGIGIAWNTAGTTVWVVQDFCG